MSSATPAARAVRSRHIVRRGTRGIGSWRSMSTQYRPPRLSSAADGFEMRQQISVLDDHRKCFGHENGGVEGPLGESELFDRPAVKAQIRKSRSLCAAPPRSSSASDRSRRPRIRLPPANARAASRRIRYQGCAASDSCDGDSRPAAGKPLRPEFRRDSPYARGGRRRDIHRCSVPSAMSVPASRTEIDA